MLEWGIERRDGSQFNRWLGGPESERGCGVGLGVCDSSVGTAPGELEGGGEGEGVRGREPGVDCLIDERQVLVDNGWKHLYNGLFFLILV